MNFKRQVEIVSFCFPQIQFFKNKTNNKRSNHQKNKQHHHKEVEIDQLKGYFWIDMFRKS